MKQSVSSFAKRSQRKTTVLLVEGEKSRLGVGNDLFENTGSVKRILCPSENAYEKYDEILKEILKEAETADG